MIRQISVVLLILLAGCSSSEQRRLIGKWEVSDVESVSDRVGVESDDVKSKMSIQFQSSGRLTTTTKMGSIDSKKEGTWKVVHSNDSENKITIECILMSQKTESEIEFVNDNTIEWIPPNMAGTTKRLRFQRSD